VAEGLIPDDPSALVEVIAVLNPDGASDVAINPINGSGAIGICVGLGPLFAILPAFGQMA
jgi:fructose-1,6-bisphosphatase I